MLTKYYGSMLKPSGLYDTFKLLDDLCTIPLTSSNINFSSSLYRSENRDNKLIVSVDLPGVKQKDIDIQMTGQNLSISGTLRGEKFKYSYLISREYNPETIDAILEDGVLELSFEKFASESPKKIEIRSK
jgi:HSP20 family molecular chaperone IbpA